MTYCHSTENLASIYHAREELLTLTEKKDRLEKEIASLKRDAIHWRAHDLFRRFSLSLTRRILLRHSEIVKGSQPYCEQSRTGVYFLVKQEKVGYVGQSKNVFGRIADHARLKDFDRFAFIECNADTLDILESLYIHTLRPELNATYGAGEKDAPINLERLLSLASQEVAA